MRRVNRVLVAASVFIAVSTLSACVSPETNNRAACEEFQTLKNMAFLVGEDLVLDGKNYSEDLKNKVIPLAGKDLTIALLKMLSVIEQTNRGTPTQALDDLGSSIQVLYDSCKAVGVDIST